MKQTRRASFIESVTNVIIGYGVALGSQVVVFPLYGLHVGMRDNVEIGLVFTMISLVRSFMLRRVFAGVADKKATAVNDVVVIKIVEDTASAICAAWQKSAAAIIETGKLLIEAKDDLSHGEWGALFDGRLPFSQRVAQRLMEISRDLRLTKPTTLSLLPADWSTIHSLTKLPDDAFEEAVAAQATGSEIRQRAKAENRAAREHNLATKITALPTQKFGVIYADPPWQFAPYSTETGMDRAADNHYPTQAYAEIAKLDVQSIAADDCVLFLWATVPMLTEALAIMKIWGFAYKSHCVWDKQRVGTGYWFRNTHELLLVGTKGEIPAPAPGTQFPSLIEAAATKHSAKPEQFLELIETYFPTLPKIELYRRGSSRKNWAAWGNQAEECADEAVA